MRELRIDGRRIADDTPCFVIAEIGHNHQGSVEQARELFVAEAFKKANPGIPVRVLVFDVPMSHYGHIERPRQLAGGLLAAVKWLYQPPSTARQP